MSYNRFLASNKPLKKLENAYLKKISLNDAKRLGLQVWIPAHQMGTIDYDDPNGAITFGDEKNMGEPEIYPVDEREIAYIEETLKSYSKKNYFAQIDFRYTKKRANKIIDYIKEHLNECDELELWSTWFDNYEPATIVHKTIDDITINDIKKFDDWNDNSPYCIVVRK